MVYKEGMVYEEGIVYEEGRIYREGMEYKGRKDIWEGRYMMKGMV